MVTALLACVVACEPPTDPIAPAESRLIVHGILDASASEQWVKVERISGGFNQQQQHVPGADVTITTPDGRVVRGVEAAQTGPNNIRTIAYGFIGIGASTASPMRGTFTLNVRTPAGEEASGSATVPVAPAFELPVAFPELVRVRDTVRLVWPRVEGAASYEVDVRSSFFSSNQEFSTTYTVFADTAITLAGTARTFDNGEVFRANTLATISVAAVETNYYTYYHPVVDPFAGAPPSRLTGAIGVFGAVVPLRLVTYARVR